MELVQERLMRNDAVCPFHAKLSYVEITRDSSRSQYDSHVHPECEIYVNLSGDVSFMVEKHIYPILPGSIVITRPFEYHHCIYHGDSVHKHFWMLFSADGNESVFPRFFDRKVGEGNLLILSLEGQKALISLCSEMLERPASRAEEYYRFFKLMRILELADAAPLDADLNAPDLRFALEYIDRHFALPISISELAQQAHVSVNTLERHFGEVLHITPYAYLKKKRLSVAAELLWKGESVSVACRESGFADYSNFIALFKKHYGITPLKYKKGLTKA